MFSLKKRDPEPIRLARLWQADAGDHVQALAWSPRGDLLAAAAVSGPVKVYDPKSGAVRCDLAGHGFGTTALAWSADGSLLASAGQDGKARLWDVAAGAEHVNVAGGAAWVERLAWCPGSNLFATGAGKKLRLWDAQGQLVREYPDQPGTIADLQWRPGYKVLASAAYGRLALWSPEKAEPLRAFEWKGAMLVLAWSPSGKFIATGDQDSTVHFWYVDTGEDLMMSGYPLKVRELSWDSTSRYLATGGGPFPCVWDCSGKGPAKTKPQQFEAHTDRVSALAFQRVGPTLASGGADGLIALWVPGKRKDCAAQARLEGEITQLTWSPDDKRLAVGDSSGVVAVYSIA